LKPKFIMCFGNEAMSLLTPYKAGVVSHCGEILENPVGMIGEVKAFVGIVVHPSAALRSTANETNFQYGAKKIKEFLDGKKVDKQEVKLSDAAGLAKKSRERIDGELREEVDRDAEVPAIWDDDIAF